MAVTLTAVLTFLCTKATTDKTSLITALRRFNDSPVPVNHGKLLVVTTSTMTAMEEVSSWDLKQRTVFPGVNQPLVEERRPKYQSLVEQLRVTNRSQYTDTARDDRPPTMSKKIVPLFIVRGKLIKKIPYTTELIHDGNSTIVGIKRNDADNIINTEENRIGSRY